jgi:hypothetical protein
MFTFFHENNTLTTQIQQRNILFLAVDGIHFFSATMQNKKTADLKLKELTKKISKNGFPKGTIKDTRPNRVLVPIGNNGYAVYQIGKNGTAKLNTTLIRK